jgi:dihydroneopterin aldolase
MELKPLEGTSVIRLNNIQAHGHHGCWAEEAVVGGEYRVDVALYCDFLESAITDDLSKTIDYVAVKNVVYREMAVRSKLIEQVLWRIIQSLRADFPRCTKVWARITKINAPMGHQVESVSVEMEA